MMHDLIVKTRSFRRFAEHQKVSMETLRYLVDLARFGGSARNIQPLKFILVNDPAVNEEIFPHLGWAGYLKDWSGPVRGERPAAYIICLLDTRLSSEADCDLGIATQNLLLGATEKGLGGCRIASISPKIRQVLALDEHLEILLVIPIGRPAETVVIEERQPAGDIRYWRDNDGVHHVPKRPLAEVIVGEIGD